MVYFEVFLDEIDKMPFKVSILVLMDGVLRVWPGNAGAEGTAVSILVLMDGVLRVYGVT